MTRASKSVLLVAAVLVAAASLRPLRAQEPATAAVPAAPKGIALSGSVKKAGVVDGARLAALSRHAVLAKVPGASRYRGTFETEGVSLKELLESAEVAKATNDNFDRPLDLAVVVTGRDGKKALFSWGELFLLGDAGAALLVERMRPLVPHHHEAIEDPRFAPGSWFGVEAREKLDVSGCAGCHDGGKLGKIDVPRGLCLVPTRDATGRRFVEDVVSIEVRQAGFPAPPRKRDLKDPWVEAPAFVLPDGSSTPLTVAALKAVPRAGGADDGIGLGRGFHGHRSFEGASLAALLKSKLPAGTDPGLLFVVVTASDGYRSLYSGGEVLLSRLPENVLLVDTEGGKPLLRKSGRLESYARADFFVDRSVRNLAEVRVLIAR
ncbi:MAG TPA: hypothetical protein PLP50_00230 [Thermoanaerobaculia bacterium]|nr:hypothetical protein [Thermoanaerobaculia bacterium]HQN06131.1 hypothetical protein [Thermoanaerobaculia bacterium]HQP87691.1 hypothetical protein [Thermoanaerobaculia bacterium]